MIFEVNDRDLIGYPTPSGYRYCCTKELVPKTKCFQDRLIYQVGPSHGITTDLQSTLSLMKWGPSYTFRTFLVQ